MKLGWDADQLDLAERMHALGAQLGADLAQREQERRLDPADWRRCAREGVLGLAVPAEHGGAGRDAVTCALAMEHLGRGCRDNGLLISLGAHIWAVIRPLVEFAGAEQLRKYLPGLCDGTLVGAHAITEHQTGSDAMALSARARRDGDHYVLDGVKRFVTNAPVADVFIVYATIDPELGFTGVTAFLVERGDVGLTVGAGDEKTGLRTSPWGEVTLDGCRVPADRVLGGVKRGSRILAATMAWERALILAPLLGTMQRQLDECVDHARTREQFGHPIGRFQAVAHRIVDMRLALESARLLTYRAAWDLEHDPDSLFSEAAQLATSETAVAVFTEAMQVFGGLGFTTEVDVARNLRDALGTRISSGTSDLQRVVIADKLGITAKRRRPADPLGERHHAHTR